MKKILFTIAILFAMVLGANAQGSDSFFKNLDNNDRTDPDIYFTLPNHYDQYNNDANAPLGSGLLILTALGAGYALKKKHEKM